MDSYSKSVLVQALASTIARFVSDQSVNAGTPAKHCRTVGKRQPAGTKISRMAKEGKIGVSSGVRLS